MDNKENIDSKENVFKYTSEVHLGEPSKPMVCPEDLKIKKVDNVIPLFVECEKDGVDFTVFAYMDYTTNIPQLPTFGVLHINMVVLSVLRC